MSFTAQDIAILREEVERKSRRFETKSSRAEVDAGRSSRTLRVLEHLEDQQPKWKPAK